MTAINKTLSALLVGLMLFPFYGKAQQIESISGSIVNAENTPLFGNAIILSTLDSSRIMGTSFFEGDFELTNINQEEVLLQFTSLEFEDTFLRVNYKGVAAIDLGAITVIDARNQLDEVVVVANIPLFETKSDGAMLVNVQNTILATSNSVEEILSRSPNVIVADEGISVIGKGAAIIYLNGQRIMNDQLANIQASEIKNIEIVSNPSAKYDAEGQAVINIVTARNTTEGIKGMLSQNFTASDFAPMGANTNFSLNYRKQRVSAIANYGLRQGVNRFILNTTRNRSEEGDLFNSDITTDWKRKQTYFANTGLGVQYSLDDDSYISVAYNGLTNNLGGTESSNNDITSNGVVETFESVVNKDDFTTQQAFTFNYFQAIDSVGSSLYIGGQYSNYQVSIEDIIEEASAQEGQAFNRLLKNSVNREIPLMNAQLDFVKVMKQQQQLEMGIKYGGVSNTSNSQFLVSTNDGAFLFNQDLSRDFNYHEEIYAGYVNYKKQVSASVNYNLGVRTELTTYDLTINTEAAPIENEYFNLFPNATIGLSLNENNSFFASYASRIARPSYQSLNPSIIYQDAFTSIQGNPNIVPEKIHAFEIGANLNKINLKLGYNYTIDPIIGGAVQGDDPKSYILQRLNAKKGHDYFVSAVLPITINWWTSTNTMTVSYNKLIDTETSNFGFKKTRPQAYVYTNNKFTLVNDVKLQVLAWYLSNRYDGVYFRKNQAEVTLGIEKSFFNKSLKIQLVANDIFHTNKPDGNYQLGNTTILFDRIYNTKNFRFIATYNFGKLKKTNYNTKTSKDSNNRL